MKAVASLVLVLGMSLLMTQVARAQSDDDFARGHELRVQGKPAAAVVLLENAVRRSPSDPDIWLELGLALSQSGRYDEAQRALDEALQRAPDYADAQIARARLDFYRGDLQAAKARLEPVLRADPTSQDALALMRQVDQAIAAEPTRWRFDVVHARSRLSNGLPSGTDTAISLSHRTGASEAVAVTIEAIRQFDISDTMIKGTAYRRWGYFEIGGAPNARLSPEVEVQAGLNAGDKSLGSDWSVRPGIVVAWARYPVGPVRGAHPSLLFMRGDVFSLQARWINVFDERDRYLSGYSLRAAARANERLQWAVGWLDAPESSEGVTTKVRAVDVGGVLDVDTRTSLSLSVSHEDRPVYRRDNVTVGLTRRF